MNQPDNTHDIRLTGCRPTPLAHYLKGLGILRLVSEQQDSNARGYWDREEFILRSDLDEEALRDFLLTDYVPTPVVSPWNAGSGVKGGSLKEDWSVIDSSDAERLEPLRRVLHASKEVFDRLNIEGKVSSSLKETFIQSCRNRWPDEALAWLDAAVVLTGRFWERAAMTGGSTSPSTTPHGCTTCLLPTMGTRNRVPPDGSTHRSFELPTPSSTRATPSGSSSPRRPAEPIRPTVSIPTRSSTPGTSF